MTTIDGDVGNSISGGEFHGDVRQYFVKSLPESLEAMALDAETVRRIQMLHVATGASTAARQALLRQGAVTLVGETGCGRRTTGIALLAGLGVTPRIVLLDEENTGVSLDVEKGHGYLLDLDASREATRSDGAATRVGDLVARLRAARAPLVVRARQYDWAALDIDPHAVPTVELTEPEGLAVFHAHLRSLAGDRVAVDWAGRGRIAQRLLRARPPDAVRLARIVHAVLQAGVPEAEQTDEVLNAAANWADRLGQWFHSTSDPEHGYRRALLLATAALDDAPAATVFTAADRLAESVNLPRPQGAPLVGPEIAAVVSDADAELREGRVRFGRPSYAESVLDYVWRYRPHLQAVLRRWLIDLPSPADPASARAADSLTALALRQGDVDLVTGAATAWATGSPALRPLAVTSLTAAAVSEQIGRAVRQRLYEWSRSGATPEQLHLVVAEVCSGPLARAYPQIALTRLRHLAVRASERVRGASVGAMAALARDPRMRHAVLREIASWVAGEDPRRSTGVWAFLSLTALRDDHDTVVVLAVRSSAIASLLTFLWREALRDATHKPAAISAAVAWLEAAAHGNAPVETVIEILAATCRTNIDLANLSEVVQVWRGTADAAQESRDSLGLELLERGQRRVLAHLATAPHPSHA
ncbi:hypothetical protein ABZ801_04885 [Actinomadura sp. NPDC047616]|uniref:hypothetical protein n=1 Tax=Actinomadura sp. NPDC047616 TaxID=3155914 RepID=UPI00340DDF0F